MLSSGCGSPAPVELTPEQIQKQRQEDAIDLKEEDRREQEYQKKLQQGR